MGTYTFHKQEKSPAPFSANAALKQDSKNGFSHFSISRPAGISQRRAKKLADDSEQVKQLRAYAGMIRNSAQFQKLSTVQQMANQFTAAQKPLQVSAGKPVAQRIIKVGNDIYRPGKKGYDQKHIIELVNQNKAGIKLNYRWTFRLKTFLKKKNVFPKAFADVNELLIELCKGTKKTASQKKGEQDQRILGMNTGFGANETFLGKVLEYESEKAYGRFTGQVEDMDIHNDTVYDLEQMPPQNRSNSNDFNHTDNPFVNILALNNSDLRRMDYMGPNNVQINTQGYVSMNDRTVDQQTLGSSFAYSTVKIGPDISSYMREMKNDQQPNRDQLDYLNALEMHRFPGLSPQVGMKRELYNQGLFSKDEGMGFNHDHSNVEFVGAINGSGLTNQQYTNMQQQQTNSNYAILQTACNICPDVALGQNLPSLKHIPTPQEEMNALTQFVQVIQNPLSLQQEKNQAKQQLRKVLTQVLRAVTQVDEVDSEDDNYPTSPYNPNHY